MSDHEVTQREYQSLIGSNPSNFKGDSNLPVEVNWDDAMKYCQKLTQRDRDSGSITLQQAYRLPTEAEWEYACRAGSSGARYGDLGQIAWWHGNADGTTHIVNQKSANAWGLYDMIGNVLEWCSDWYGPYPLESQGNPTGPSSGSSRVSRGGGWAFHNDVCRAAWRNYQGWREANYTHGVRPVLSTVR